MVRAADWETAFSVEAAARTRPDGVAVRAAGRDYSFADMARLARDAWREMTPPPVGRPWVFTAGQDVRTIARLYALLEHHVPMLPLSPKLTPRERETVLSAMKAVKTPLPPEAALVMFTSGTTGAAKPVVLTREALLANARAVGEHLRMTADDVWQLSLSPARIGGLGIVTRSLAWRSTVAVAGRYDPQRFAESLERDCVTIASVVPAMLADVLERLPQWRPPERMKAFLVGGSCLPAAVRREAVKRGCPVMATYAMTETASTVAMTPWNERFSPQEVGCEPLPGAEIRLRQGEIEVRGAMTAWGIWGAARHRPGTWLATGDAGEMISGRLVSARRRSDLLISGGEKVLPDEVEHALEGIDGVKEALVLGLPDEKWGVIVAALIVPRTAPVPDSALVAALADKLARYKCPRRVAWVTDLPRTTAGKLRRSTEAAQGAAWTVLHYTTS